jgi:hypothetical protein
MRTLPITFGAALLACIGGIAPTTANTLAVSFADAPTGWSVDRYAPDSFSNIGVFAGRTDVLGISIGPNGNFGSRTAGFNSSFYNTQGMSQSISGGAGSSISLDLYVDASWATASSGFRRTDMWGVVNDASKSIVDYPIIGYTNNDNGFAGFRVYNDQTGSWLDLKSTAAAVNYGAWNSLAINFTGSDFIYDVNGVQVADLAADPTAVSFSSVIMQGYNCNSDPSITNLTCNAYTADWAVPEPATLPLMLAGLGLVALQRRRSAAARG